MSTAEREVLDAVEPPHPAPSMALVPLTVDRAPPRPASPPAKPGNAHRFFYAIGYAGLALLTLGTAMGPRSEGAMLACYALGAPALGLGGMGVLLHTVYRPSMRKLRQALGAVAALVLTAAAQVPVARAAEEVHAAASIARLQPLADELARDGRIRSIGRRTAGFIELNGYRGRLDGSDRVQVDGGTSATLAELLRRDGISRLELVRLLNRLDRAGVRRVDVGAGYVALDREDVGSSLLYVRPGQPLPPPGTHMLERGAWRTQPLGGGWYLLLQAGGWD